MEEKEILIVNMFRDAPWPGNILSNFSNTPFVIDGINCACTESFIQSLKISDISEQKTFCSFGGEQAWETGSKFTEQV
ncbi:MAG: Bacteriophage protein, partial [Pseudomonadota bacterium]